MAAGPGLPATGRQVGSPHLCERAASPGHLILGPQAVPRQARPPPRPGPALRPLPPRLGTGVAKQDLGCCFIRTSWKNLGGPWPPVTRHVPPSGGLAHTLPPCKHLHADLARGRAGDSSGRVVPGLSLGTISHTPGAETGLVQGMGGTAWAPHLPWGERPPAEGPLQKRRQFRPPLRWGPSFEAVRGAAGPGGCPSQPVPGPSGPGWGQGWEGHATPWEPQLLLCPHGSKLLESGTGWGGPLGVQTPWAQDGVDDLGYGPCGHKRGE